MAPPLDWVDRGRMSRLAYQGLAISAGSMAKSRTRGWGWVVVVVVISSEGLLSLLLCGDDDDDDDDDDEVARCLSDEELLRAPIVILAFCSSSRIQLWTEAPMSCRSRLGSDFQGCCFEFRPQHGCRLLYRGDKTHHDLPRYCTTYIDHRRRPRPSVADFQRQ